VVLDNSVLSVKIRVALVFMFWLRLYVETGIL